MTRPPVSAEMPGRQLRRALRVLAIAIAAAAAVDPAITVARATRPRIALVVQDATSAAAERVRAGIARGLAAYVVVPHIVSDAAAAILIGDRYPTEPIPGSLRVSTVTIPADLTGVRLAGISASRDVPPATAIRVDVDVDGERVSGATTVLRARVAGIESASASHRWTTDGERWRASLDVMPVGEPPFLVRIEAATSPAIASTAVASTGADLVVRRRDQPAAIEFFDARPSWASTFVRRALESDPRFRVESFSSSSRGRAARTSGGVPLDAARLDAFEAVVVGGLDALTSADVAALDRYMRERGGAVVLLPDQRIESGPLVPVLPQFEERLLERPASLVAPAGGPSLRASELLVATAVPPGSTVVAQTPDDRGGPVVVTVPRGDGRLLISGAMDAWRSRSLDGAAFDRFWQSVAAGLAFQTPPLIGVEVTPSVLRPGELADLVVRVRPGAAAGVSATVDGQPIRLAPDAEAGVYRGRFAGRATGPHTSVEARGVDAGERVRTASQVLPIVADGRPRSAGADAPLMLLAASHRGVDAAPGDVAAIQRFVRDAAPPSRAPAVRHPMRSTWWMMVFVTCLCTEWWLRRRHGNR
jgi:hypothetical protein